MWQLEVRKKVSGMPVDFIYGEIKDQVGNNVEIVYAYNDSSSSWLPIDNKISQIMSSFKLSESLAIGMLDELNIQVDLYVHGDEKKRYAECDADNKLL